MNYFFIAIILALGGGGYYEYTTLQQEIVADQQNLTDLHTKVDSLQADNQKLLDNQAQLTKSASDAQVQVADMTKQLQGALSSSVPPPSSSAPSSTTSSTAGTTGTSSTGLPNLTTITTLDGKTYANCKLLKITGTGIVISFTGGITEVPFGLMPPELQKAFGYDPHQAAAQTQAQLQYQQEQQKASAQASGGN